MKDAPEPAVLGPKYYREQARQARLLANRAAPRSVRDTLFKAAKDFDEIAEYLEAEPSRLATPS
jgi:hypothetical protein